MYKIYFKFLIICLSCIICFGCSKENQKTNSESMITVDNYTFYGDEQRVGFIKSPKRVLVCGTSGVDTLIALGVRENLVAAVLTESASKEEYEKKLPGCSVYNQPLQLEKVVALQPDFILGWRRFFAQTQLGDTTTWIRSGIPAYIQDASGPIPAKGKFPACTIDSEINFIHNMGMVFSRQERAQELISEITHAVNNIKKFSPSHNRVLFVEFINGNIEVFGSDMLCGDIVKRMGGKIIEYRAPFVSQEELMQVNPDFIFVIYHGGNADAKAALRNLDNLLWQHLSAIKNNRVIALNYNLIAAPGVNIIKTIKKIESVLEI